MNALTYGLVFRIEYSSNLENVFPCWTAYIREVSRYNGNVNILMGMAF